MSIQIRKIMKTGLVALALPLTAYAADEPILFNEIGGVKSWRSGGDALVFVLSKSDQWYRAELGETCMSQDTSKGVRFLTENDPATMTKSNRVVVNRSICTVISLTKVDAPDDAKP
jgi:hypothetical protein